MHLSAAQIRAARALLELSREDLARLSNLSYNTIRNIETSNISPRDSSASRLRLVFESAGLNFTEDDGVRRERADVKIIRGLDSADSFFDSLLHTVKKKRGEVLGVFGSVHFLIKSLGIVHEPDYKRLDQLAQFSKSRFLLPHSVGPLTPLRNGELRTVPDHFIDTFSHFVFGNRYALIHTDGHDAFQYIILKDIGSTMSYRDRFNILWNMAAPTTSATHRTH